MAKAPRAPSIADRMRGVRAGRPPASNPAAPRPREARTAARREAILAAALDEFSQQGFEAARLDDVAKRAGVAKGTIYLYFRDKETLFQELIRAMLTPVVGSIEAMGAVDLPIRVLAERIDRFLRARGLRNAPQGRYPPDDRGRPALSANSPSSTIARCCPASSPPCAALLARAAERGEVPAGLVDFPQIIAAPGLVAIIWSGLFERFEPLDVRAMMKTHLELLFAPRSSV